MKKSTLFYVLLSICMVSCSAEEEVFNRARLEIPEGEEAIVEMNREQSVEEVVHPAIQLSKDFFDWYKTNREDFYGLQAGCVGVENEYYVLDKNGLSDYIAFLSKAKYFSKNLISKTEKTWLEDCSEQMKGLEADGIPPCVYEGDLFFLMQETPSEKDYESLSFITTQDTLDSVTIDIGGRDIVWIKEDGEWKMASF